MDLIITVIGFAIVVMSAGLTTCRMTPVCVRLGRRGRGLVSRPLYRLGGDRPWFLIIR